MPCFHPLQGWQTHEGEIHFYQRGTEGKIKKGVKAPNYRRELNLPCGRCIGCRLERSKIWSIRLMHEAQMHEANCFVTLTYDDKRRGLGGSNPSGWVAPQTPSPARPRPSAGLERGGSKSRTEAGACQDSLTRQLVSQAPSLTGSLNYRHVQAFLRSLRQLRKRTGLQRRIRFYMCGEYGEQLQRPHYHLCLFGEDFREDRYQWRERQGIKSYRSPTLEKLWPHGNAEFGDLTIESAAYVARYIMKKITGDMAHEHYKRLDPATGELYWLPPEFSVMSRRPGIGKDWFTKFTDDVYPHDHVIHRGKKMRVPRYYDKLMEALKPLEMHYLKDQRQQDAERFANDNTPQRKEAKEKIAKARMAFYNRKLETS